MGLEVCVACPAGLLRSTTTRRCTRRRIRAYVQLCFLGLLLILVATFSNGMWHRPGLAVAVRGNPELGILDEPTSADPIGQHDSRTFMRTSRDRDCAVFLNSHLLSEVEQVGDQVAVISHRGLMAPGAIEGLVAAGAVHIGSRVTDECTMVAIRRLVVNDTLGELRLRVPATFWYQSGITGPWP